MIKKQGLSSVDVLSKYKNVIEHHTCIYPISTVLSVTGSIIKAAPAEVQIGESCKIVKNGTDNVIEAEVIGFNEDHVLLSPLGSIKQISLRSTVIFTGELPYVYVGQELLGRVVDSNLFPLDGKHKIYGEMKMPIHARTGNPLNKSVIDSPLYLGVRAIDAFLTVGKGQRIGIFSGSGVGKSTLLSMISSYSQSDINIIALIGERSREVTEFVKKGLSKEALENTILVVSTANETPMNKIKAALVANTIAEYFQKLGKDVLLLIDSLTRLAMAQREIGLSAGEPVTTKGYPTSVFSLLPNILERAGVSEEGGSITGIYTVLVEADDFNEPISDATRGILDGHIILSRKLNQQGFFPSIDIVHSISRLAINVMPKDKYKMVMIFRECLALYEENEDIIKMGAYASGQDPLLDIAIQLKPQIDQFLKQDKLVYDTEEKMWQWITKIFKAYQELQNAIR